MTIIFKITDALARLRRDNRGTMVIETALVTPVLALMAIGGFEVSHMVARQHELQGGVSEATSIALAANLGAETDTQELASLLRSSLDLEGEQVIVTKLYRCDASSSFVATAGECENYYGGSDDNNGEGNDAQYVSSYVKVELSDSYSPIWSKIGVGSSFTYDVERMVQLS